METTKSTSRRPYIPYVEFDFAGPIKPLMDYNVYLYSTNLDAIKFVCSGKQMKNFVEYYAGIKWKARAISSIPETTKFPGDNIIDSIRRSYNSVRIREA